MFVSYANAETIILEGTVRDFYDYSKDKDKNPDFENKKRIPDDNCGNDNDWGHATTGLVTNTLIDGKLTLNNKGSGKYCGKDFHTITSAASFSQWYEDVEGINESQPFSIELTKVGDVYVYENLSFFPIDGKLIGNECKRNNNGKCEKGKNGYWENDHNYHFTYEIEAKFTYKGGETFTFYGDDDVWVYIDNRLVVDVGGIHSSVEKSINLDSLGLTVGKNYNFNFFFAERHITGSNLKITTSIELESKQSELIAEYRFDECIWDGAAGEVKDSSGNNLHGAKYSSITTSAGDIINREVSSNAHGSIRVDNNEKLNPDTITVMAWIKPNTLNKWSSVIVKSTTPGWADGWGIAHYTGTNDINFYFGKYNVSSPSANIKLDEYSHVVGTYDGSEVKIYINGELKDTKTLDSSTIKKSSSMMNIARGWHDGGKWDGKIDEVKIYDGALSLEEIKTIYNNEKAHKNADGSDRDAVDCAVPFKCDDTMYFSNAAPLGESGGEVTNHMYLHTIDRSASPFSFHNISDYSGLYNGLAYNPIDNFLYATSKNKLLRIGSDGTINELGTITGITDEQHFAATFDRNGFYYLTYGTKKDMYKINVSTLSIVETITLPEPIWAHDMTIDESGNYIYFMSRSSENAPNQLKKIDIANKTISDIGDAISGESRVETLYSDVDGRLFAFYHEDGFYELNTTTGERTAISNAPITAYLNDGAMCPNATVNFKPILTIGDATVTEGDSGTTDLIFPITYREGNATSIAAVTFDYTTKDGNDSNAKVNATSSDYTSKSENGHSGDITIEVIGDTVAEADESLHLVLSNITGALYHDSLVAKGTIIDNDMNIIDAWDDEGSSFKNRKIRTEVVGQEFTLFFAKINAGGQQLAFDANDGKDFGDENNTRFRVIDTAECDAAYKVADFMPFEFSIDDLPTNQGEGDHKEQKMTINKAYKDASVQFYWEDQNSIPRVRCSTDNFSVRPDKFDITLTPSSDLKAGEDFNITIRALDKVGNPVTNYTGDNQAVYALDYNDTKAIDGCVRGELTGVDSASLVFIDGVTTLTNVKYSEVGQLNFTVREIEDKEYALVDADDTPSDSVRLITEAKEDGVDFGASKMLLTASLTSDAADDFVFYAGNSDSTKDETNEMAAKLETHIIMQNASGVTVTNFRDGCYAEDVKAQADYSTVGTSGLIPVLMYDDNTTDSTLSMDGSLLSFDVKKELFTDGEADTTVKINFQRDASQGLNPMRLTMPTVKTTSPVVQDPVDVTDGVKTFIYLKAHVASPQSNIGKSKDVKVDYEVYSKDINRATFGLSGLPESEDEVDWYIIDASLSDDLDYENQKALFGGTSTDNPDSVSGSPSAVGSKTVLYHGASRTSMKIVVPKLPAKNTILYEPSKEYLKYNRFNALVNTHKFKINFLSDTTEWMGKGDLGMTIDNKSAVGNGLQKMDW